MALRKFSVTVWDSVTNETSQHTVEVDSDCKPAVLFVRIHNAVQEDMGDPDGGWSMEQFKFASYRWPLTAVSVWRSTINPAHLSSENIVELTS